MNNPLRILLVEDQPADARLLKEALIDCSVPTRVDHAVDGEAAIDFIYEHAGQEPDIIILDLNMPRKDGHEFLDEMKEFLAKKDIPVIMLTVSDQPEDINRAMRSRLNFFVRKPVQAQRINTILEAINDLWASAS